MTDPEKTRRVIYATSAMIKNKKKHTAQTRTTHVSLRPRFTSQRVICPAAWMTSSVQKPSSTWKMGLE